MSQLQQYNVNYAVYMGKQLIYVKRKNNSHMFIRLNLQTHHASVVKSTLNLQSWDWIGTIYDDNDTYLRCR